MDKKEHEHYCVSSLTGRQGFLSKKADIRDYAHCLVVIVIAGLIFIGAFGLLAPAAASAETVGQLEITGDGVANPVTLTMVQLQGMEQYQHVYSTINTWPTKRWYIGQGVKIRDLMAIANIKPEAQTIIFTSSDSYSVTLTVKELLKDPRYYFPGLQENSASDGSIPGSPDGAQEVESILALLSAEGSVNPDEMNDMYALLMICGQRAVTEQTNNLFLKYITKIEVLTAEPPQWDKPKVNVDSGVVSAGTLLELNTKGSDVDKIYYTTDGSTPNINSPMYNWSAKRWWSQRPDSLSSINRAIEIREGTVIKAVTIGPGRLDSEVVTFTYKIGTPYQPQVPGGPPVAVTLDEEAIRLKVGASYELAATVGPGNAVDKSVTWHSSNTSVAVVDNNGLVTLVGPGAAVITVKTVTGGLTASCLVTDMISSAAVVNTADAVNYEEIEVQLDLAGLPAQGVQMQEPEPEIPAGEPINGDEKQNPQSGQQLLKEKGQKLASIDIPGGAPKNSDPDQDAQTWQVYEMSAEAVSIELPDQFNILNTFLVIVFVCLFLSGAGIRYREFIKEAAR
jgi:hypothetical protein